MSVQRSQRKYRQDIPVQSVCVCVCVCVCVRVVCVCMCVCARVVTEDTVKMRPDDSCWAEVQCGRVGLIVCVAIHEDDHHNVIPQMTLPLHL